MTYAIAQYLTEAQVDAILAHRFVRRGEPTGRLDADGEPITHPLAIPASADDCICPMGYLGGIDSPAPSADEVAEVIFRDLPMRWDHHDAQCELRTPTAWDCNCDDRLWSVVAQAAVDFIEDWDANQIPPERLAQALGR